MGSEMCIRDSPSTGVITCNNTAIVQSLDIYVKVTVNHNWGTETINKITVKASLK